MVQIGNVFGQAGTSAESVHPMNQFSSSSGGVNLFSGDVYLPQRLYVLPGRNGMDISLDLKYSSNVLLNVIARNDHAPTGWLGLGWELKLGGNIRVEHNNTMTLDDDRYFYTSSEGVSQRIYASQGKFFLEREPYWKVERELEGTKRIRGWKLTDPSGKVFRYGDNVNHTSATRNATRYTFAWEGGANNNTEHVGEGFAGTPALYPFQWDLAEIEDLAGNKVKYQYTQVLEKIAYKTWANSPFYTKASYLTRIVNPENASIEFETREKDPGEVLDPKDFAQEPDIFMEFYETKLLRLIRVKNHKEEIIREFEFCYSLINDDAGMLAVGKHYKKSLLRKVFERDGVATPLGSLDFDYYDDYKKRISIARDAGGKLFPDYNFGALKSMRGKLCGKVEFEYSKQDNGIHKESQFVSGNFGSTYKVKGGRLENGNEYIVVSNAAGMVWIFNWESGQWKPQHIYHPDGNAIFASHGTRLFGTCYPYSCKNRDEVSGEIVTGTGFFVIRALESIDFGGIIRTVKLDAIRWSENKWVLTPFKDQKAEFPGVFGNVPSIQFWTSFDVSATTPAFLGVFPGRDFFAVSFIDPEEFSFFGFSQAVMAYRWDGAQWSVSQVMRDETMNNLTLEVSAEGNNVYVKTKEDLLPGNDHQANLYHWNGSAWTGSLSIPDQDRNNDYKLMPGFFARVHEEGVMPVSHYATAWTWNGMGWTRTLRAKKFGGLEDNSADISAIGDGYFATRYDGYDRMKLFQWQGEIWNSDVGEEFPYALFTRWRGYSENNYFLATYPRITRIRKEICPCFGYCCFHVSVVADIDEDANIKAYNWKDKAWHQTFWNTLDYPNTEKNPKTSDDFFVHSTNPHNSFVWDGSTWQSESRPYPLAGSDNVEVVSSSLFAEKRPGLLVLHRKFQNQTTAKVHSFVVRTRTTEDPVTGSRHVFTYDYAAAGSMYDTRNGTAKFNKVTVTLPNHGKEVSYFFNDYDDKDYFQKNRNPDYMELDGFPYKKESYDVSGKKISEKEFDYHVYRGGDRGWPTGTLHTFTTVEYTMLDGVRTHRKIEPNYANGLPSEVTDFNSDGTRRITRFQYAFEVPTYVEDMSRDGDPDPSTTGDRKNMLTQLAATTVYEGVVDNQHVKMATTTTWEKNLGATGTARFLSGNYVWNKPNSSSAAFVPFNFANPGGNAANRWEFAGSATRYDAAGRPVEMQEPSGAMRAVFHGHKGLARNVSCSNVRREHCAVFTGDYDDDQAGEFDPDLGWQKGGSTLSSSVSHFGSASVHVQNNQGGPTNTVGFDPERDYVFSAWVYPVSVNPASPAVLSVLAGASPVLPDDEAFGALQPGTTGGWQKIERILPGDELDDLTVDELTIKVSSRANSDFYVDDIRFHPKDALVTTQYYNPKLLLPTSVVSPGGGAEYSSYDEAGRLVATFREDADGSKIKLSEIDYQNIQGCSMGAPKTGRLAKVSLSEGLLDFDPGTLTYGDIKVANTIEKITIKFQPENPEEPVAVAIGTGAYETDCCNTFKKLVVPLGVGATTVRIKVGSAVDPYVFTFTRLESCWSFTGGPASGAESGKGPAIGFATDIPYVAFKKAGDGRLYIKKFNGGTWEEEWGPLSDGEVRDVHLVSHSNVPYVAYIDNREVSSGTPPNVITKEVPTVVVKKLGSGGWAPVGGLGSTVNGIVSKGSVEHMSFDIGPDGTLWAAFVGDPIAEDGLPVNLAVENRVYARKLAGALWVPAGDFLPTPPNPETPPTGDGIQDGIVSEFPAGSLSLAVGPDNLPLIAFTGSQKVIVKEGTNPPHFETTDLVIILKKLKTVSSTQVWGSLEEDAVPGSETRLGGDVLDVQRPKRVFLRFNGTRIFLAYDYEYLKPVPGSTEKYDVSGENMLTVREFLPSHAAVDGGHWIPVPEGPSPADTRIMVVDPRADYHFTVRDGVPQIVFTNEHGGFRLTAIAFDAAAGAWKSIGIPGFAQGVETSQKGNIAIGVSGSGTRFVAYTGGADAGNDREGKVNFLRYNAGCKDPTLSRISVVTPDDIEVPLELSFKQYYTVYRGSVDHTVPHVKISATANNCSDIGTISLRSNDITLDSRTISGGCTTIPPFTFSLVDGLNEFDVWGVDVEGGNSIRYQYAIYKRPNPVPSQLVVETVPALDMSPGLILGNPGPYEFEDVGFDQSSIVFKATFSPNTTVWVNGIPVGSGHENLIELKVGVNEIKMLAGVAGEPSTEYVFRLTRMSGTGTSHNLSQIASFMHPIRESFFPVVSRTSTFHEIFVTGDIGGLRVVRAEGNTCPTLVNDIPLGNDPLPVALPGNSTNLLIERNCAGQTPEQHLVVVIKTGIPTSTSIVGHRESGEPAGFYKFADLEEAHRLRAQEIAALPASEAPSTVLFYVIADLGTDIVESPPVEIEAFQNNGNFIPIVIEGILKGSSAYLDLLNQFQSQVATP